MLAGDFNTRTGNANYFIDDENCNFIRGNNMPCRLGETLTTTLMIMLPFLV